MLRRPGVSPVSKLDQLLSYLKLEFDTYPYHVEKDPKYFSRLIAEFPDLDLDDELRQYHAWALDQPDHKKIYYRSRFRSWLKTSLQFKTSSVPELPHWLRRRHAQAGR